MLMYKFVDEKLLNIFIYLELSMVNAEEYSSKLPSNDTLLESRSMLSVKISELELLLGRFLVFQIMPIKTKHFPLNLMIHSIV